MRPISKGTLRIREYWPKGKKTWVLGETRRSVIGDRHWAIACGVYEAGASHLQCCNKSVRSTPYRVQSNWTHEDRNNKTKPSHKNHASPKGLFSLIVPGMRFSNTVMWLDTRRFNQRCMGDAPIRWCALSAYQGTARSDCMAIGKTHIGSMEMMLTCTIKWGEFYLCLPQGSIIVSILIYTILTFSFIRSIMSNLDT